MLHNEFSRQREESVLFLVLDSCRYDTFMAAAAPNLKSVGPLVRAMAPGNFTYSSHMAMFMGFTPGDASMQQAGANPKFGKIFRMSQGGIAGKAGEHFLLQGRNIIDGFKRKGYLTVGSGAVGWFNTATETSGHLIGEFDDFHYPGNTWSLSTQLAWLSDRLAETQSPVFCFLNIGETHVPYYFEGADWSVDDNPCIPFSDLNDAEKARYRQIKSIEFVDQEVAGLLKSFAGATIVVCADHGDCWGEDGLWEHGISHEKVLEVPLLFRLGKNDG